MSTLRKTEVFYTNTNNVFEGKRHAVIERDDGAFCTVRLRNGETTEAFVPSQEFDKDRVSILTVQIDGEIFYRTGRTGNNTATGIAVQEMESYKADGSVTGNRLWIDTETGNNVFAD